MTKTFHEATVLARQQLTPGMVRLTLGGDGMKGFVSSGVADEYLRLFFPHEATGRLHLPIYVGGRWTYPEGREMVRCSTYTVRRHDPRQALVDIDFVVHKGGRASEWAQAAEPGARVTVNTPHGLYTPPEDIDWQLLVADATGLPALSRILEQTPPHVRSHVFIEVAAPDHQQSLPQHPNASVSWLHASGNGIGPSRLAEIVRAVPLPVSPGYIWVAGEQKAVREIRNYLRGERSLPSERYELVAYWTDNRLY